MDHESQTVQPGNPKDREAQWRSCERRRSSNNTPHYKNNLLTRLEEANNRNNNDEPAQTSCRSRVDVQSDSKDGRLEPKQNTNLFMDTKTAQRCIPMQQLFDNGEAASARSPCPRGRDSRNRGRVFSPQPLIDKQ